MRLASMGTRVQSLASLRGLRIQHCYMLWCRLAATTPIRPLALEPSCYGWGPKKNDKRQKNKIKLKKIKLNPFLFFYGLLLYSVLFSKREKSIYYLSSCGMKTTRKKLFVLFLGKSQTTIAYSVKLEVKSICNALVSKDLVEEGL